MPFDSPDYNLAELLNDIGSRKIQLPDFQREWKWDDDRIASLLASISLGYPVGVIMLLEVGEDGVRFAPTPIAGVADGSALEPSLLILDGQQRLTSLFQALRSQSPVETMDARGKRLQRWYYIDMKAALDPEGDREEAILHVPEDKKVRADFGRVVIADYSTVDKECEAEVFPFVRLFDIAKFTQWSTRYLTRIPDRAQELADRWNAFQERVLQNIMFYKLPAIILTKETPKEAVCTVFEKVNTGGVPLNVFELLTATFAADGFRLKDDWKERKARLAAKTALRSIENTDFLQAVTLLATRAKRVAFVPSDSVQVAPGISAKRKDVLQLSLDDYEEWAGPLTQALEWSATFLAEERIFRGTDLPYRTQLVPLSAIKVVLGNEADTMSVKAKLRQWYWCGVLGELYGGTTETRFARDLEQVVAWVRGEGDAPNTVEEATFRAARLLTVRTRNSAAYKGIYALVMRSDCRDWVKGQPMTVATFFEQHIDVHHIFPKAWCERNGIDRARRESIVNKTPLSYETNRSIGGRSPADYMPAIEKKAAVGSHELDEVIRTHLIDPRDLRTADFDSFFAHRREALLELIEEAMGKPVVRDEATDEGDLALFEDEPEEIESELPLAHEIGPVPA